MRRKGLLIVLALTFWPLLVEAVTRDNFLMRTARDCYYLSSSWSL